jgi:Na+/H+-dicarboxylate symporter
MRRIGLLPKLVIAIILGILIGSYTPQWFIRIFVTFNSIFGSFLGFMIPLIIIGFVAPGIGDLGRGAGRLLAITAGIAYLSTLFAGSLAYFTSSALMETIVGAGRDVSATNPAEAALKGFFEIQIPPIMGVMSALVTAFILGLGISFIQGETIKRFMAEFQQIIEKVIADVIIPLLPLHILGIFANMAQGGQVQLLLSVFARVFVMIIILHITVILIQYIIAGAVSGANPFRLLRNMIPAYFTAIGTQSSAATIPVTLVQTKKNGVHQGIADFVIPLSATIHLSGSTISLVACAMAVMQLSGLPYTFAIMFPFIMMLGITMVAAPGVPGGAIMAALGLLSTMLGFTENLTSLMIALYIAQDSFGTACNVTGDGAVAVMVNRISGHRLSKV